MDGLSPAVTDAFHLLCADLYEHLSEVESLASQTTERCCEDCCADVDALCRLVSDLVLVIRGLLIEHQLAPSGNCQTCPSVWPCPVVTTIHGLIKNPDHAFVALVRRAHDNG